MAYPQARQAMNQDRLARGYAPPTAKGKGYTMPYGKGKGKSTPKGSKSKDASKGSWGKGASNFGGKSRLQSLISGHWQRSCPMNQSASTSSSTSRPAAAFFICRDESELSQGGKTTAETEKKTVWYHVTNEQKVVNDVVSVIYPTEQKVVNDVVSVVSPVEQMVVHDNISVVCSTHNNISVVSPVEQKVVNDVISTSCVLTSFIGLTVEASMAVLDTGAQSAVIGKQEALEFSQLSHALESRGLRSMRLDVVPSQQTRGIGGKATVLSVQQVPIGICGVPGLLTVQVLDQDLPLLLHIGFMKGLGCVLNLEKMTCAWGRLGGRASHLHEAPSGHLLISVLECKQWRPPDMNLHVGCHERVLQVEIWWMSKDAVAQEQGDRSYVGVTRKLNAGTQRGPSGTASATIRGLPIKNPSGSEPRESTQSGPMLGASTPPPTGASSGMHAGAQGHAFVSPEESGGSGGGAVQGGGRSRYGQGASTVSRKNWHTRARRMCTSTGESTPQGQLSHNLVDMSRLWVSMGEEDSRGEGTTRSGTDAMRETQGSPLQSDSRELQTMGDERVRAGWGQYGTSVPTLLSVGVGADKDVSHLGLDSALITPGERSTPGDSGRVSDGERRRRDDSCAPGLSGLVVHGDYPGSKPGPPKELQHALLQALQRTLVPKRARRHADPGARGCLLGLYTQQGGTGVTRATQAYGEILELILKMTKPLRIEFTSIQINVLEKGDEDPGPGVKSQV
eukprot:5354348-Amphidinium_carterae.6